MLDAALYIFSWPVKKDFLLNWFVVGKPPGLTRRDFILLSSEL